MNLPLGMALPLSVAAAWAVCPPAWANGAAPPPPPPSALKITLAIPSLYSFDGNLTFPRTLINQQPDAHFDVVIENVSNRPVFLWDESNSIGYRTLSLNITETDGRTVQVRPVRYVFKKNSVHLDRLAPGEAVVREIYYYAPLKRPPMRPLSHFEWEPLPFPPRGGPQVTMQAVFEQPVVQGDTRRHLWWTGRAVSKPISVILDNAL